MLGVNVFAHEPNKLKEVMAKEDLNWRTFDDDGTITKQWNSPATPAFYVIDHDGVIRHKWIGHPGEMVLDAALDTLIEQAETAHLPR